MINWPYYTARGGGTTLSTRCISDIIFTTWVSTALNLPWEVTKYTGNSEVAASLAWQKWKYFACASNFVLIIKYIIKRYYFGSTERTAMTKTTATMLLWVIFRSTILYCCYGPPKKNNNAYSDIFLDIILFIKTNFWMRFPVPCTHHTRTVTFTQNIIISNNPYNNA